MDDDDHHHRSPPPNLPHPPSPIQSPTPENPIPEQRDRVSCSDELEIASKDVAADSNIDVDMIGEGEREVEVLVVVEELGVADEVIETGEGSGAGENHELTIGDGEKVRGAEELVSEELKDEIIETNEEVSRDDNVDSVRKGNVNEKLGVVDEVKETAESRRDNVDSVMSDEVEEEDVQEREGLMLQEESSVAYEVPRGGNADSFSGGVEAEGLGGCGKESDNGRSGEAVMAVENEKESEVVKEEELPVVRENQDELSGNGSEEKDSEHKEVKVDEVEVKLDESSGEMEIAETYHIPDKAEEDDKERGDGEADVAMKQADDDDESKGYNEGSVVDSENNQAGGSQMVVEGKLNGEELCREMCEEQPSCNDISGEDPSLVMDNHSFLLDGNTSSKVADNSAQGETAVRSPVGNGSDVGLEALSQDEEEEDDFRIVIHRKIESQDEEAAAPMDEVVRSPVVADKDKDIGEEEETQKMADSFLISLQNELVGEDEVDDEQEVDDDDEVAAGGTEMEIEGETEAEASKSGSDGKQKWGRKPKLSTKTSEILVGDDVCFICLDGGELVLCDHRGCPKAYHPSCVDRDEAFFRAKGRWTCGWHLCSICEKNAYYKCCTCAFSLCKGCIKDAVIFCIRGNRGVCESCMKTVMLIEDNEQGNEEMDAFDDKSQWEYLFKDYWIEQKEKLSFTAEEIAQAKNPWKGSDVDNKQEAASGVSEAINDNKKKTKKRKNPSGEDIGSDIDITSEKRDSTGDKRKDKRQLTLSSKELNSNIDDSSRNAEKTFKRGRKAKKLAKSLASERGLISAERGISSHGDPAWASEELLEFAMHMKNGDRSVLSQFDVQELLLQYIKRNKLRDPRCRSQIVCDPMLEKLFGKPRVGHFEMLKLLESHLLIKEDSQADDNQGGVIDSEGHMDIDENAISIRGRKSRKKDARGLQSNLDDYAAIDMHNINLIYLRRNLVEALLEDSESFSEKVVGSFVRIRISGSLQKQDLYRLVQVVGVGNAPESYRFGKRTTDVMLEILNLDKTELVSLDTISNQEFTEDECKRLCQSIKCGLIDRLTVGVVLGKAKELHKVRVTDLLKTPKERQRRLDEIPVVHDDPKMDPSYDSDDESDTKSRRQETGTTQREYGSFGQGRDPFSARKGGLSSSDSRSPAVLPLNRERDSPRDLPGTGISPRGEGASHAGQFLNRSSQHQGADKALQHSNSWEKERPSPGSAPRNYADAGARNNTSPPVVSEPSKHLPNVVSQVDAKINEAEKSWHYRDPTGKVQGPFSMIQLRKWNTSGFFPANLRIWRTTKTENDSILLSSALTGNSQKEPSVANSGTSITRITGTSHLLAPIAGMPHVSASQKGSGHLVPSLQSQSVAGSSLSGLSSQGLAASPAVFTPKLSTNVHALDSGSKNDSSSYPSPSTQSSISGGRKSRWSPAIAPSQFSSPATQAIRPQGRNGTATHTTGSGVGQSTWSSNPPLSQPTTGLIPASHVSTNAQLMPSQTAVPGNVQTVTATTHSLPSQCMASSSSNHAQGVSNMMQSGAIQNSSAYGSGSTNAAVNPNQMAGNSQAWGSAGPQNNPNMMQPQQAAYGYWGNAPVNGQPQAYGTGQLQGSGNFPDQNIAAQNQQMAQAPTNMPWMMAGQGNTGVPTNMGWVAAGLAVTSGQVPAAASGQAVVQSTAPPAAAPGTQSGGTKAGNWPATGNANPATWVNQQKQQLSFGDGGPSGSKGQGVCRFHESGHCKKGASCNFMHT
ncbi:Zinc finger CCCH domain-containing protein [Drosera capensis]